MSEPKIITDLNEFRDAIAKSIREEYQSKRISYKSLASQLGVSTIFLSQILGKKTDSYSCSDLQFLPKIETLLKFAQRYGIQFCITNVTSICNLLNSKDLR